MTDEELLASLEVLASKTDPEAAQKLAKRLYKSLTVLSIFRDLCKDSTNYVEPNYATGDVLYIDGMVPYKNSDNKKIVSDWLLETFINK